MQRIRNYFECRDKQKGQTILCVWQWWNWQNICLDNTFVPRRGQGKIVLVVASSRIASLLLLGGKTAHSRFKIPIGLLDESICNITQQMKVVKLVCKVDLIIWDEAPMMHRRAFEAVDRTLCDLMQLDDA